MKIVFPLLLIALALPAMAGDLVPFNPEQRRAMQIETASVEPTSTSTSASLPGRVVVPNAQLHVVTAPLRGLIKTLLAAEGEQVRRGQALAHIQSPTLLELQGEYLEAYTRYQLEKSNFERDRTLRSEEIISQRRFQAAQAKYQEALTTLTRVQRMLELSGMDEDALAALRKERRLDSTLVVKAPFDGVLLEQMTTAGKRVEAADPLYRIASLKPLWLEIHTPLRLVSDIHPGQRVTVPALGVSGPIITIGHMVHGTDQGVLVRAEISDGAEKLRPGQFVQVQLAIASQRDNFRVPRSAVVRTGGSSYVFVERENGFQPLPVQVVAEETSALVITGELEPGARVVVSGSAAVKAAWLGGE